MSKAEWAEFAPVPVKAPRRPHPAVLVVASIGWTIFLLMVIVVVPKLDAINRDFGIPLPAATIALVRLSHLAVGRLSVCLALLVALWVMTGVCVYQGKSGLWAAVMLAVAGELIGLTVATLGLPLLTMDGLRG